MVPTIFLDTFVAESVMQNAPSYSGSGDGVVTVDYAVPVDRLALKYVGRSVYVWKGKMKGKVGMVQSMSGDWARISFASAMQGGSVRTLNREHLIR